jgi:translation initiation factor IF-2
MEKDNKKKTLTISSDLKKKIDTSAINTDGKKSFAVKKKEPFRGNKNNNRPNLNQSQIKNPETKKKNFARKFIEQQATKAFIKKDDKPSGKSKLKLKAPIDKRDFKLTVSRALNVEEIEIKQRSLASVKRARLKEKKNNPEGEKREFKKVLRDVKIPEQITIQELSNRMAEKSNDIIKFLFNMKVVATINHVIDKDTAEYIVKEFGHTPVLEDKPNLEISKKKEKLEGDVQIRPPVVTIMGHVDHGKTSC